MQQKYLHKFGLFILLILLGMVAPLSTDMYLPALPGITSELNTDASIMSLTLVVFNFFMAIGVVWFGCISDKFGRKKVLISCLIVYFIGNLTCYWSYSVEFLIFARSLQAFGGGGMVALSLAIVKDFYVNKARGTIIAVLQSFTVVAPIIAPLLGALILHFATWREIFLILSGVAVVCIVMACLFQETIPKNEINHGSIWNAIGRIFVVAKNKKFTVLLLVSSFYFAGFFVYLSSVSFVYEEFFNLTQTEFSIYFAINATCSLLGPILCILIGKKIKGNKVTNILFLAGIIAIILIFAFGQTSAIAFLCSFIIYGIANSFFRPYATDIMLDQHSGDTGSASALLNFSFTIMGAIGMYVGTLPWPNYVVGVAAGMSIFVGIALILWIYLANSKNIKIKNINC